MCLCVCLSPFSDDSVVLKVITIYNKDTDTVEEVLLEELQVFQVQQCCDAEEGTYEKVYILW